jgi:hypothetical protein
VTLLRRNPNRRHLRATARGPVITVTPRPEHCAGDIVRITRDNGSIDTVRIITVWTAAASCICMLTVAHHPHSIRTFAVRADSVVPDDAPDGER